MLALVGSRSQDRKKAKALGDDWEQLEAETSWFPFQAIWEGRTSLDVINIGWVRPLAALAVFVLLFGLHETVIGLSPLP